MTVADVPDMLDARGSARDEAATPGLPARLVLRATDGLQVDLHPLEEDARGNGLQRLGMGARGLDPAADLGGSGRIGGRSVRRITPALQLRSHLGWDRDEQGKRDVRLLGERFDVPLPPGHGD